MAELLPETPQFQAAVQLINKVDVGKFSAVLARLMKNLRTKTATFTADERTQLAAMFSLSSEELSTVLQSCVFALEQFTYNVSKPNVVGAALTKAGFTEEHAATFTQVYTEHAEKVVGRVRNSQFGPRSLETVSWSLNLQSSEDTQGRLSKPTAVIELGVKSLHSGDTEHMAIEADHDELHGIFDSLERLQEQIDAIS